MSKYFFYDKKFNLDLNFRSLGVSDPDLYRLLYIK